MFLKALLLDEKDILVHVYKLFNGSMHTSTSKHRKSIRKPGVLRAEMMEESESGQNWLKNQVKVVCEREILASLVEFKHHSMAETIQNEKEEKKTKAEAPGLTKKDKKHQTSNLHISVTAASAELIF